MESGIGFWILERQVSNRKRVVLVHEVSATVASGEGHMHAALEPSL